MNCSASLISLVRKGRDISPERYTYDRGLAEIAANLFKAGVIPGSHPNNGGLAQKIPVGKIGDHADAAFGIIESSIAEAIGT